MSTSNTISAHTEVETEKLHHIKKEKVIDDTTVLDYPGPIYYAADETDDDGMFHREGSVRYAGEIWLVERPVVTLQAATPMTQWGIWDCALLHLNLYDWAGDRGGVLPGGEHKNELTLNGLGDLLDLLKGNLVLQYPWSAKYRPSKAVRKGMAWLEDEDNRRVGPVEWDRFRINEDVAALEPSIVTPT